MKTRFILYPLLAAACLATACGGDDEKALVLPGPNTATPDPYVMKLSNSTFEDGLTDWVVDSDAAGKSAIVEVVEKEGVDGSKCLKVQQYAENGKCYAGVKRTITGLKADAMYRLSARVKYSDIAAGCGACVYPQSAKQYWNCSKFTSGTHTDWTTLTCDFMTDDNGSAVICCSLGFWQGGRANGGKSTGTAYFDNVTVREVTDELYMRESKHIRLFLDPSKVAASNDTVDKWLANLDKIYEAYADLVGGTPHEGRKLAIVSTEAREYWAVAGYPIIWVVDYVESTLKDVQDKDDWCFGLMHEIGHVFNIGNASWDWNDEMFANFRMHYGLEAANGKTMQTPAGESQPRIYQGAEIRDFYKGYLYETKNGSKVMSDNGIHWELVNLTTYPVDGHEMGWEPFKKAFAALNSGRVSIPSGGFEKFKTLVNTVQKYAREIYDRDDIDLMSYYSEDTLADIKKKMDEYR